MKPFIRSLSRILLVVTVLCVARVAMAQAVSPTSTIDAITLLIPKFVTIGTALSAFLAVLAAQFPQATWISKIATILGYLPVIDIHGLTTGTMQKHVAAAALTAAVAMTGKGPNAAS
jgi:hypothetical protein